MANTWIPDFTDKVLSPYTGLTRDSWVSAGIFILKGIFSNIENIDMPVVMKRKEMDITYPHSYSTSENLKREQKSEIFEGLTRSFFIASVIINEKPNIVINGISIREYYKRHILRCCCMKDDSLYVGTYTELYNTSTGSSDKTKCFQQTVETCALVIGLECCRKEIWETYTQSERDSIAAFLRDYAENATAPKNWRLFNMLDLAFLYKEGYEVDEKIMGDHVQAILGYYAGDGWYRDGLCFDYYSCWAFNLYAPIWCRWYGYKKMTWAAVKLEEHSNSLMKTYHGMFDNDGFSIMWGRSCIYRNATTSAFIGNLFLDNSTIDPGIARRICSGSLLQFITRDDFLCDGIPSLGFYHQFIPVVQGYSCTESPLWLGKAFLCLHLPKDHSFWTSVESENYFDKLNAHGIKEFFLSAPGLCFTNHKDNGETILRTAKVFRVEDDINGIHNYAKLCYNSKYPWESSLNNDESGLAIESMMYIINDESDGTKLYPNAVFLNNMRNGVLYRRAFFNFRIKKERMWMQTMTYADFPVPLGIFRVDKICLYKRPITLTLGSYGFPDNGTEIINREKNGAKAIILKGLDHVGKPRQLAVTVFYGWDTLNVINSENTNPDSNNSIIVYSTMKTGSELYDISKPYVLISQTITKNSFEEFTDEELFPLCSLKFTDPWNSGAFGPIELVLYDETIHIIDFEEIEGNISL